MSDYSVRPAGIGDAAIIATHRAAMFHDMGELSAADVATMKTCMTPWFAERLASGDYVGWFVEHDTQVVAGGGVLLRDLWSMPRVLTPGRNAHVGNVYTEPAHRRRGLARLIMETILDWCAVNAIGLVTLSASPDGRSLYEHLGFSADSRAMRWFSLSDIDRNTPAYPRA
jgi:GNAT superfamily N-acetyltransferase